MSNSKNITDDKDNNESPYLIRTIGGFKRGIYAMALTPDGREIVSSAENFKVWSVDSGLCNKAFDPPRSPVVRDIQVTPDGQHILAANLDNTVEVIDLTSNEKIASLKGHNEEVNAVTVSTDGKFAISGSADGTIKLWNFSTGECQSTLRGHKDEIKAVTITSDNKIITSGSNDYSIRLWQRKTGKCLATLEGHKNLVFALSIAPDDKTVISGSADKNMVVGDWQLPFNNRRAYSFRIRCGYFTRW